MEVRTKNKNISLNFTSSTITGIISTEKEEILNMLYFNEDVYLNTKKITKQQINDLKKQVSVVNSKTFFQPYLDTVQDNMEYLICENRLIIKDPLKKMQDSLKIVGLNSSYLTKSINALSTSEKKQIGIAICLLSNPNIIILDEPFLELDKKNEKRISRLLIRLKEDYNKMIIIVSNNINMLYKYCDRLILIKNNEIIFNDMTNNFSSNISHIIKSGFDVPDIVLFTYKVKKNKKVNISYHQDIRDIIKDIYKHI